MGSLFSMESLLPLLGLLSERLHLSLQIISLLLQSLQILFQGLLPDFPAQMVLLQLLMLFLQGSQCFLPLLRLDAKRRFFLLPDLPFPCHAFIFLRLHTDRQRSSFP